MISSRSTLPKLRSQRCDRNSGTPALRVILLSGLVGALPMACGGDDDGGVGAGGAGGTSGAGGRGGASGSSSAAEAGSEGGAVTGGTGGASAGTAGDADDGGASGEAGDGGTAGRDSTGGTSGFAGSTGAGVSGGGAGSSVGGAGSAGYSAQGGSGGPSTGGTGGTGAAGGGGNGPNCVEVTMGGDDTLALAANGAVPFGTIQAAIDFASTLPGVSHDVCVAQGSTCGTSASYPGPNGADLRMRSGVNVRGDYESTNWTLCDSRGTTLAPQTTRGVHFGSDIVLATALERVTVERFPASPMTGVSVNGAHPVALTDVTISGVSSVDEAVGVDIQGGADVTLVRLTIPQPPDNPPVGARSQFGVRALESTVTMSAARIELLSHGIDNPGTTAALWLEQARGSSVVGSTLRASGNGGTGIGVHVEGGGALTLDDDTITVNFQWLDTVAAAATGVELFDAGPTSLARVTLDARVRDETNGVYGVRAVRSPIALSGKVNASGLGPAYGVVLDSAPGSSIAAQVSTNGNPAAAISITGDAHGVSITNASVSVGGNSAVAITMSDCAGASPSIADNPRIYSNAASDITSVDVIRSLGDCHPLIERNDAIVNAVSFPHGVRRAIHCGVLGGVQSRCTIADNPDIHIEAPQALAPNPFNTAPIVFTGIDCETGCAEIRHNDISALTTMLPYSDNLDILGTGVKAGNTPIVAGNRIWGGIGMRGVGLESASARIENNVIQGPTRGVSYRPALRTAVGLVVSGDSDVHSNTILSGGSHFAPTDSPNGPGTYPCRSDPAIVKSGHTLFRNNVFEQQYCVSGVDLGQVGTANYVHNFGVSAYFNGFPGNSGNFDTYLPPGIDGSGHLQAGSPCIDAGTADGRPAEDIDGDARDSSPDIGADEWAGAASPCRGVSCSEHGVCLVADGTARCHCDDGWAGATCSFADTCKVNNGGCDPHSPCTPQPGGRTCGPCAAGFTGAGETGCIDIDECLLGEDSCEDPAFCVNLAGDWACDCPAGFHKTSRSTCDETNECLTNNGDCDPLVTCTNTVGSRTCGPCPSGYTGTGESGCVDIDECATNNGGCAAGQSCTNVPGGHTCAMTCNDLSCEHGGTCVSDAQHAACVCPQGYSGYRCELATAELVGAGGFCARLSDGTVACWGAVGVSLPGTYTEVVTGYGYACGLDGGGHAHCAGSPVVQAVPADVFVLLAGRYDHVCGIHPDGTVACWGANASGQATPPAGSFTALATGYEHSCGIHDTGELECWGTPDSNFAHGQEMAPAGTYKAVAATIAATCAIRSDGAILCWGEDFVGAPPPAGSFKALALGSNHGCAIRDDGTLSCWGPPSFGQTTPPAGTFTQVAATPSTTCALRVDGVVVCFGLDETSGLRDVPNGKFDTFPNVCSAMSCARGSCSTSGNLHCACPYGSNRKTDDPFVCITNPCFDGNNGGCPDSAGCAPSDTGAVCFP